MVRRAFSGKFNKEQVFLEAMEADNQALVAVRVSAFCGNVLYHRKCDAEADTGRGCDAGEQADGGGSRSAGY